MDTSVSDEEQPTTFAFRNSGGRTAMKLKNKFRSPGVFSIFQ